MNKKGFTLVELLAVITIIALVSLIGTVSIAAVRNKINQNLFESKLEFAVESAKIWGQDNKDYLPTSKSIEDLIVSGKLETSEVDEDNNKKVVIDNTTGESINALEIKIYLVNNRVNACIVNDADNLGRINDKDQKKYDHLNLYCE